MTLKSLVTAFAGLALCAAVLVQAAAPPLDAEMDGFAYPHEVRHHAFTLEGQPVRMAYMDVAPAAAANGRTALLLHGRNFGGYYWENTIRHLTGAGFRVVVPDQVGFGKSSKPDLAYSFHAQAEQTRQLLDRLGVGRVTVIAHSMGGMLGVRFTLMFPARVERLVLEGPIGLEDYRLTVPYAGKEALAQEAAAMTREALDRFYRGYFATWRPEFQVFADVAWGWMQGPDAARLALVAAQTYRMAYEQPVVYELPRIAVPTLIVAGARDRSAIGRNRVPAEARETLGRYTELVPAAARAIPGARGELLENVGHIPHVEAPARFHALLDGFLSP